MSDSNNRNVLDDLPVLSPDEVIRVLEVRPRQLYRPSASTAPEPRRVVGAPQPRPVPLAVVPATAPPTPRASPPTLKPVNASAPPAQPAKKPPRDSLEDTMNELRAYAFELESDDTGTTSRVRHLNVEIDRRASKQNRR